MAKKVKEAGAACAASVRTSSADSKGRLVLGAQFANKMFRVSEQPDGNLLLEPVVAVHEREAWLYHNPDALASVRSGIEESKSGKGEYLGSFSQYATDDDKD